VSFAAVTLCVASQTSITKGKRMFCYRLSPETFGYTIVIYYQGDVTEENVTGGERVTQGRDDACIQNFSPKT
jgi:hypothetical protein